MSTTPRDPIVFGQIASLSGSNYMGLENKLGAELAVRQLNAAGGVLGRRVDLLVTDDGSHPHGAVEAYLRLDGQRAAAVIGTSFSNASLAVLPHTDECRLLYVSTGAAHQQVCPPRPYVFMTPPPGPLIAEQLLRFLHDSGIRRIAVVFDSDSVFNRDAWAAQEAMLSRYAIDAVVVDGVNVDTADFGPTVLRARASQAQTLMAWVTGPPAVGLARALTDLEPGMPTVMGLGAASPGFLESVGSGAEGLIVATSMASVGSDLPKSETRSAIEDLTRSYESLHGATPSQFAIDGYIAVELVAAAVETAKTDDRHAVRDAMETLTCKTAAGTYAFSAEDHSGLQVDDVAVAVVRDGRFRLTQWSARRLAHVR